MAPQTDEFGTKVALLGGLVVVCAARPLLDRLVPEPGSAADDLTGFATRITTGGAAGAGIVPGALRMGLLPLAVVVVGVGIVAAGTPARGVVVPEVADVLGRVPHDVDPATFPTISVAQDVVDWNHEIAGPGARELVLTLAENLELEAQALLRADPTILAAVDHGDRLDEMQGRLQDAVASGTTVVERYQIDDVRVDLLVPFGKQSGLSVGLESRGTVTKETYDSTGDLMSRASSPFTTTFALRQVTGGRWLNVAALPAGVSG
jgi:hypothetical protein